MIHSVLPQEAFYPEEPFPPRECLSVPQGFLEGVRQEDGSFLITRLISTDPAAYLDPALEPGAYYR